MHASRIPNRALQQLRHERGRALLEEVGLGVGDLLDPAMLWADVEAAFAEHDRRQAAASAEAANLEFLGQVASAARKLHDLLQQGASSQRQAVCSALEARLLKGGETSAGACTALRSPEFLLAFVAAARAAAHDLKSARAPTPNRPEPRENVENGWILAEGLPAVFARHTGLEVELEPENKQQSTPTACMCFLKAAFELSGREVLSDAVVLATILHWKRAQQTEGPSGQEAPGSNIVPPSGAESQNDYGRVVQSGPRTAKSGLFRLLNRSSVKPLLRGQSRTG